MVPSNISSTPNLDALPPTVQRSFICLSSQAPVNPDAAAQSEHSADRPTAIGEEALAAKDAA